MRLRAIVSAAEGWKAQKIYLTHRRRMFHPCKGPVAASTGYVLQPVPCNRLMISNRGKDRSGKRAQTGILPLTFAPARIVSARWPGKELGFGVSGTERRWQRLLDFVKN